MNELITSFGTVASALIHPLALIGFVLMLFFGMLSQLIKAGLLPQLTQQAGGKVVMFFLRYGFWLTVLMMLLGFSLQFYKIYYHEAYIHSIVTKITAKHQQDLQAKDKQLEEKDSQIKTLTEAIKNLADGKIDAPTSLIKEALTALEKGDTTFAIALFKEKAEAGEEQAIAAYRYLGALAWWEDTPTALHAYQHVTKLLPEDADSWNQLGLLYLRMGELSQAENAFLKVLQFGEQQQNQAEQAAALCNLGIIYKIRREFDKSVQVFKKSLNISENLDKKQDMASCYTNLGNVYRARNELDKAIEMYEKSLAIEKTLERKIGIASDYGSLGNAYLTKALDTNVVSDNVSVDYLTKALEMYDKSLDICKNLFDKECMATNYKNLGIVYAVKNDKQQASVYWKESHTLFKQINNPEAEEVQKLLKELYENRD